MEVTFQYGSETLYLRSPSDTDHIGRLVRRSQSFYEVDVLERLRAYLSRSRQAVGTVIDVGAYIGNHTLFFSKFCNAERIIAFEPFEPAFELLQDNIRRNNLQNVRVFNLALGSCDGWGKMTISEPDNLGSNQVTTARDAHEGSVRITSLDSLCSSGQNDHPPISLIKIDVEGCEPAVLEGALRTIMRFRPLLCIEIVNARNMRRVLRVLKGTRYLIRECNGITPAYVLQWRENRSPLAVRLLNLGWLVLASINNSAMSWRYRRLVEILDECDHEIPAYQ